MSERGNSGVDCSGEPEGVIRTCVRGLSLEVSSNGVSGSRIVKGDLF